MALPRPGARTSAERRSGTTSGAAADPYPTRIVGVALPGGQSNRDGVCGDEHPKAIRRGWRGGRPARARRPRHGGEVVVCSITLDTLHLLTEEHGPAAGNQIIREVARRLTEALRTEDTVGLVGA